MKHGYKVLLRANRKLMSFTGSTRKVRYRVGRPTRPNPGCGPLAVFKTKEGAQQFSFAFPETPEKYVVIYPCVYKPSRTHRLWYSGGDIRQQKIRGFPEGTDFASEVIIQKGNAR